MKYIIGLLGFIIIAGAGCTSSQNSKSADEARQLVKTMATAPKDKPTAVTVAGLSSLINTENASVEEIYKAASDAAGYHIYYPTFIPANVVFNKNDVGWTKTEASIMLNNSASADVASIIIMQSPSNAPGNIVQNRLAKLTAKESISINGQPANYGIFTNSSARFETVIFSTSDGVDIALWSKTYPKNVLIRVAESLK